MASGSAPRVATAVRNNAEWCDAVCRSHGVTGTFCAGAWCSPRRTPPHYPDAVTLAPSTHAIEVLAGVDSSPGCSVKDSFATLDLHQHGFDVLFEAQWYERPPGPPSHAGHGPAWEPVVGGQALARWEEAWRSGAEGAPTFLAALLDDPTVTVLGARDGPVVVAGAIVNRSATVVGLTNLFTAGDAADAWAGCLTAVAALHPDLPVVGYGPPGEGSDHGFRPLGPLRVWIRP